MTDLERCVHEQKRCQATLNDPSQSESERFGAFMGWCDWEVEKGFIEEEATV